MTVDLDKTAETMIGKAIGLPLTFNVTETARGTRRLIDDVKKHLPPRSLRSQR